MVAAVVQLITTEAATQFTLRDRMEITRWDRTPRIGRVVIDQGNRAAGAAGAEFALIYLRNERWARWGISRSGTEIIAWCCRTGADLSPAPTATAALQNLPT